MLSLRSIGAHSACDPSPYPFTPLCLSACAVPSPCSLKSLTLAWCWQGMGPCMKGHPRFHHCRLCFYTHQRCLFPGGAGTVLQGLIPGSPEQLCLCTLRCGCKGEPAAPRLSLKGSSTLSSCFSSPALPGACWAANDHLVSPVAPSWETTSASSALPSTGLFLSATKGNTALPRPTELGEVNPTDPSAAEGSVGMCCSQGDSWDPLPKVACHNFACVVG